MFSNTVTSYIKLSGYGKQLILNIFAVKGEKLCPFQGVQGLQPKLKDFPGPGIFFCQFQVFQGFPRTVATLVFSYNVILGVTMFQFM